MQKIHYFLYTVHTFLLNKLRDKDIEITKATHKKEETNERYIKPMVVLHNMITSGSSDQSD